jgi:membrane protease YdiL (CAAX protease family)
MEWSVNIMRDQPLGTNDIQRNAPSEGRSEAAGLLGIFERHPMASALGFFALDFVLTVVVNILATAFVPPIPDTGPGNPRLPDFVSLLVMTMVAISYVSFLRWWRVIGFNRSAEWRNLPLLLPTIVPVFLPVLWGFRALAPLTVLFFLIGYVLTGFREETVYRGIIMGILRPVGVWPAVLVSSLFFSIAHSANLFVRFSGNPGAVLFQMLGTFVIGIGFAALRLRTNTLWGVIVVHMLLDFFQTVSQTPKPLVPIIQGTLMLLYGIFILLRDPRSLREEQLSSS